jgi:rubrerythrin
MYEDLAAEAGDAYTKAILEGLHEQEVHHEEKLKSLLASIEPTKA